jgi:serine/threonine-protein phosphatase 2A regulatory subunit B'
VYITPQFVQEFLELFDSEESFERDYLKNILHKLYAKVSIDLPGFKKMNPVKKIYQPFF